MQLTSKFSGNRLNTYKGTIQKIGLVSIITATTLLSACNVEVDGDTGLFGSNIEAPALAPQEGLVFIEGENSPSITLINNGGAELTSCHATNNLPDGLVLNISGNANHCVISGTATATSDETTYVISAQNSAGNSSISVSIEVLPSTPKLSGISAQTFIKGEPITPIALQNSGGQISECATSSLPEGLTVTLENTGVCEISGTASQTSAAKSYSITASNASGRDSIEFQASVVAPAPLLADSYSSQMVAGYPSAPLEIKNQRSDLLTQCSIQAGSIPSGLSLELSTNGQACIFSGTPELAGTTNIILSAQTAGSTTTNIQFVVTQDTTPPTLTLKSNTEGEVDFTLEQGEAFTDPGITIVDDHDANPQLIQTEYRQNGKTVGDIDTQTTGSYEIIYTAADAVGNTATITRLVNIENTADTTPPSYEISAPLAQRYFSEDKLLTINWTGAETNPDMVELEYSLDDGLNYQLITLDPVDDTLEYNWDISAITPSETVKLRLTAIDKHSNASIVESKTFSVQAKRPEPILATPAAGQVAKHETTIEWAGNDLNYQTASIYLSSDSGANFDKTIAKSIQNTGSYTWNLSAEENSNFNRIRLELKDQYGNIASTESAGDFVIDNSTLAAGVNISAFNANYYYENDGSGAGKGTDGSDTSIVPVLKHSETTEAISLNYIYSEFNSINSHGFYGTWEGTIEVTGTPSTVFANVTGGWADIALYVDDQLVEQWDDRSDKTLPLDLSVGTHTVRFEFHNHWHTTTVNVSFSTSETTKVSDITPELNSLVTDDSLLVYVGAYESADTYNAVNVEVLKQDKPVVLFLSSYQAVRWYLENADDQEISAIVVSSYTPASSIDNTDDIPVFHVSDLKYAYDNFADVTAQIESIIGRGPDRTLGKYSLDSVTLEPKGMLLSDFQAEYYFENDGSTAGQGTDGTDATIIPVLKHSETTEAISLNYIYSDFNSINSHGFYGIWQGTIEITGEPMTIFANVAGGWADMSLYIDDVLVDQWAKSNKSIPLELTVGQHDVRFEFHNHWHTTNVNVSFSTSARVAASEISTELNALITNDTHLAFVGAYESADTYNIVNLEVLEQDQPVVLFLSTYEAVRWQLENPSKQEISAIVVNSYTPASSIANTGDIPVFHVTGLKYAYNEFDEVSTQIENLVGRKPDVTLGEYSLKTITLP